MVYFILTSLFSNVQVSMLTDRFHVDLTRLVTEENWTDVKLAKDAYFKSKTLAEKAAWDFVAKLSGMVTLFCEKYQV